MKAFQIRGLAALVLFTGAAFLLLSGCAPVTMMPAQGPESQAMGIGHAPRFEDGFAVSSLWGGQTWRIFLRGSDPDGDMSHLWVVITQLGLHSETQLVTLRGPDQARFSGFLTLDTPSWIRTSDFVRVEVRIRDRAGNLSDKATFEAQVGFATREGLPSQWADATRNHLGTLFFQFRDDGGDGRPFGRMHGF
ncbi:MAG: hypothetical protein MUC41_01485 [Syntrophobacteraceae bacterium]|jgi:hypothetical protein|nr:hypothetical protein [Syntrophobacteraceae bacterium]